MEMLSLSGLFPLKMFINNTFLLLAALPVTSSKCHLLIQIHDIARIAQASARSGKCVDIYMQIMMLLMAHGFAITESLLPPNSRPPPNQANTKVFHLRDRHIELVKLWSVLPTLQPHPFDLLPALHHSC